MQNNIENKIAKILTDILCYCYCDNCEFGNYDKYQVLRKSLLLLLVKYDTVRKAFEYKLLIFSYTVPLCIVL
jgi:hypothetical protein